MPSRPDPAPLVWREVRIQVAPAQTEHAAALLAPFAPAGVAVSLPFVQGDDFGEAAIAPDGRAVVSAYLPDDAAWPARQARIRRLLAQGEWRGPAPRLTSRRRRAADWATAWQRHVGVVHVGRLVIRPTHRRYQARPGEVVVDLEPGMAFGTGQHESTRLALALLERRVRPGMRVLDLGSGSGILACAAARLGARQVVAVDLDPLAVLATRRNAALNHLEAVVDAREGATPGRGRYDLVIANITAPTLIRLAPRMARAVRPGGTAGCSGIIAPQLRAVRRAVRAAGLEPKENTADGDWRAFRATRPPRLPG